MEKCGSRFRVSAITGSKLAVQILNKQDHCINYSEVKALETEFAFSVAENEREAPDGIKLCSNLSTAFAWDNDDANVETLDGKATLHATVGHTYQNISQQEDEKSHEITYRSGRNRPRFAAIYKTSFFSFNIFSNRGGSCNIFTKPFIR